MRYAIVIEKGPTSFGASVPDLPGCISVAESREEAERLIREAIEGHLETMMLYGDPIPEPTSDVGYVEIDMAMKRKAIERCQPPVPTLEGESRWHARQDIIQWLEDLSAPKSYVKQNPRRPTPSDQTAAPAPAQFHIISGFT